MSVILAVAACGGGDGPSDPIEPGGPASLELGTADIRFVALGEVRQLAGVVRDAAGNVVAAQVAWSSDNTAVATVDQTGLVTARGFGTTKVRATAGSLVKEVTVTVMNPQFNVKAEGGPCDSPVMRTFTIEAQSAHLTIIADTQNPAGGFTTADYESFAATFESLVWPVLTGNFGLPSDIDGNGKVIAFFTSAVNELTPAGSGSVVGGFFYARDLFPKTATSRLAACPGSNEAELFYLLVPDPNGAVNGNVRAVDNVRKSTVGVIAHEFQHLINAGRRLHVNTSAIFGEVTYLEEGLSHIAEELVFYTAGGLSPRSNITIQGLSTQGLAAINSYQVSNLVRFGGGQADPLSYLKNPAQAAPYTNNDVIATRGATWAWLRYLNDRGNAPALNPPLCSATVLQAGGACRADGSAGAQIDISAGASSGDFVIVAFNDGATNITTDVNAVNAIPATGPPTPSLAPGGALFSTTANTLLVAPGEAMKLDMSFHLKLRDKEKRELRSRVPYARAAFAKQSPRGARLNLTPGDRPSLATIAGEDAWARLVNSNDTGMVNLRAVFGQDIRGFTRDWVVANYTDDAVQGLPPQLTHPSWNFREILTGRLSNPANSYPLPVRSLTAPVSANLINGGSAHFRLGVAADATSIVRFTVNGAPPPTALKLMVVRTR